MKPFPFEVEIQRLEKASLKAMETRHAHEDTCDLYKAEARCSECLRLQAAEDKLESNLELAKLSW